MFQNIKNSKSLIFAFALAVSLSLTNCSKAPENVPVVKELNVYNWSNYIGKNTVQDFEKEFGIKVNYDTYASNEELLAKIQAGVKGYDIIVPSDYMVTIMVKQNLLSPLDMNKIPNFAGVSDKFKNLSFDPANKYSVPYHWGTNGIGIDTTKVTEKVDSWDILWNKKYKGRITMLDDMRAGLIPAMKKLGYSINTLDPKQLEKAKQLMIEQKPLVKAYSSETYIDMLKSGDAWISYGYSGDVYQVAKDNHNIRYVIPKEGTNIWIDNMCIPQNAPHKETAELFIDYILRPKVSADITNETWYASPVEPAKQYIKKEILDDPNIYPTDEIIGKCEFIKDVGDATKMYDRIWNEIKSN